MARKKRQDDPYANDSDSSSENSSNTAKTGPKCVHIKKAVDPQKLRRSFKKSSIESEKCVECVKMPNGGVPDDNDFEYDRTLWLCLHCGSHLCSRSVNGHALKHFQTPRSESHAITLNTTTFEVWCYDCDADIGELDVPVVKQCKDYVKSELAKSKPSPMKAIPQENGDIQRNGVTRSESIEGAEIKDEEKMPSLLGKTIGLVHSLSSLSSNASIPGQAKRVLTQTVEQLPRIRGLSNLGNTCFFNSVMQCLAQTPFLLPVLKELEKPNVEFSLPGGKFQFKDSKEDVELEPISGKLKEWGPLTAVLAETIEELQQSGGVYNPRKLFSTLTKAFPQFGGGDQHDSHELLRHLLEGVKTEDLKRYQRVILAHLNWDEYRGKKDLNIVPEDIKQKAKFYGQQAQDRILCPEQVFRGFLVSTLTCQECLHSSSRHENFLDLSLPVIVEKPAPPIRHKNGVDGSCSNKESTKAKHQKQIEQRNRKNRSSSSPEQSDADVEDNLSEDINSKKIEKINNIIDTNGNIHDIKASKTEKQDDGPENLNKDLNESVPADSHFMEAEISVKGGNELARQMIIEEKPAVNDQTTLLDSFQRMDINERKEKLSKAKATTKRKRLCSRSCDWSSTIAPRHHCSDGECSVQSCLNNFTAVELMTGNNKVACDACSERINGKDGKTINTNATKLFLISSPPAVLILHLKRFQVGPRCLFRKMNKHVEFPFVLDLASYCASKVKTLPNVHRHQKKLIYSLYAICEHSGSMGGGHYVAYVKVRKNPDSSPDDPRWKFLPKGSKDELDQLDEQKKRLDDALIKAQLKENRIKCDDSDDCSSSSSSHSSDIEDEGPTNGITIDNEPPPMPTPPAGKWYYVSDSHVNEVSEERVAKVEAYLLFYERIY